jgi:hypothetical protein
VVHFWQENVFFYYILYYFEGNFLKKLSRVLRNIKNEFLTKKLHHNFCYLSNDNVFSKAYMYSHTYACLNTKPHQDGFCEIT